eukprot:972236-Pelagomonas_calceolata.AAC.2
MSNMPRAQAAQKCQTCHGPKQHKNVKHAMSRWPAYLRVWLSYKHCKSLEPFHVASPVLCPARNSCVAEEGDVRLVSFVHCPQGIAGASALMPWLNVRLFNGCNDTPADTTFPCVNLEGNPFHDTTWLAFEEAARTHACISECPDSHAPKFKHFSNLHDALRTHIHSKHRLGYYSYYQSLLPTAHKKVSSAFWTMPTLPFKMKWNIFNYRTGTLFIKSMQCA